LKNRKKEFLKNHEEIAKFVKTATPVKSPPTAVDKTPSKQASQKSPTKEKTLPGKNMAYLSPLPAEPEEHSINKWSSSFVQKKPSKDAFIPNGVISVVNRSSLNISPSKSPRPSFKLIDMRDKLKLSKVAHNH
jgi:hypothetical protein